jgi:hypothetical protein
MGVEGSERPQSLIATTAQLTTRTLALIWNVNSRRTVSFVVTVAALYGGSATCPSV